MEAKHSAPLVRPTLHVAEQFWEDGGVRLARCWLEGGSASVLAVIPVQGHPSASIIQRLEREYALRTELDPAFAVHPRELRYEGGQMLLVLEDPGGRTLDRITGTPFQIDAFLGLAIPLTAAIGQAHARGLIHKDIKPANIFADTVGSVWLTGFGIASRLPREHQAPAPPEVIAGTLAYMAPEQTGRMNRSVDARSDLYALGVTFYEMLTGVLPFTAADPMEWMHCHIARQPVPPSERITGIPGPLSAIVLKLLAKTAGDRYQTAAGLAVDLRRCQAEWQATGGIAPFPLGTHDASDRLLIPETLYGREREINRLLAVFNRVVARGTPELVLVSGYSGIGKSSVVNELHKALVPPRGLFASGKFDQYKRDIPYATLAQALRSLVRPLLGQSEAELGRWRETMREALGLNGQLIVDLVPELELVIGKHPPVPELPPQDAQNRFQLVFRRFLGVFAQAAHPLALFLDDLQWLDLATLDLLEHLATHSEVRHLLLVGAYRDNEVGPTHPLLRTLDAIRGAGARVQEIVLAPLGHGDVGRLVADALHCAPARAQPLAQLVHDKTGGNPFFAIQFFIELADEGLLALDPVTRTWQWDMNRIRAKSYTDNVVDLMAGKLKRLPAATRDALQQLACLGNAAEIATLASVYRKTEAAMHAVLWEAVYAGLVFHEDSAYKFLHDRIQQAAYTLIPEEHRANAHLRIGRVLLASMTADDLAEHLFDVVNQLNRGAALLVYQDEKVQVATLNLRAGRKAKASTAYVSAGAYFAAGMALLDETGWGREYDLMFNLRLECAECAFLSGEFDKAELLIAELLQHAASKVDIAAAYHLEVQLQVAKSEYAQAVAIALTCLHLFGIDILAHPTWEQVQAEYDDIWPKLAERQIESLIDLPLMTDTERQAAMRLLSILFDAAYFTDLNLFCWLQCRIVNVSLQYGMSGAAAHAYSGLGYFLGPIFHRYGDGHRFARLACNLVEKHGFLAYQAKVYFITGLICAWNQPISDAIDFLRRGFRTANETGALAFACYCLDQTISARLVRNDPLDVICSETEKNLDFVKQARFRDMTDRLVSHQRFIETVQGRTSTFSTFNDTQFDETAFEAQLAEGRAPIGASLYWILKLKARFLSGDYAEALEAADKAKVLLQSIVGLIVLLDYFYYTALTVAVLYEAASAAQQATWRDLLAAHQAQLREWSETYPPTFGDKHALVSAELARLEGRDADAMRLYEQAIQAARENGFVQNEGLAYEIAARFYAARGVETIADAYLRHARFCYLRWGAEGKVRQLEQSHPRLRDDAAPLPSIGTIGASVEQLELGAVVKAAQAVSREIVLARLMETLMTIALEHAGAERALLLLFHGDELQIEAEATTGRGGVEVTMRRADVTPSELPESVLHTVIRTQHSVILDDASAPNPFAEDSYVCQAHARSVLCLPLVKQAKLIGVLYLENSLASHVFTPARTSVLEVLASQAAISLENARLYADLLVSEARWHSLFENVAVGVVLVGTDGRFVEVNPAFCKMTGYSKAELRHLTPADITHEDDRAATEGILSARAADLFSELDIEKRYQRKDGGIIWAKVSVVMLPAMSRAQLLSAAVMIDITERKRAEEELRRSEASLAQAQHISHTGSWRWKVGTGELSWSAEHFYIFDFDPATTQPSYATFMARIHPEDRPALGHALDQAARDRSRFQHEYRIALPNGSVKYLQSVGQPDSTECGSLEFVGTVLDITERRHAEDTLRDAQADLTRVARLTTLGELAASLVHEISQPLGAIALDAASGLRWLNLDRPNLEEAREALSCIKVDSTRAGDMIRGLRALAQKSGPQLARLGIRDAIEEMLALTRGELQRHGIVLHADLSATDQPVLGDRVQLQQVLLNLIMNGIQAMAAVTDRGRELTVSVARAEPDRMRVTVEDTGPGLDPDIAQRIFEPFFTTKSDGLGMGLSICRSIIEAHGGQLQVSARTPHGTAFHFTIPIAPEV